MAVEFKFDFKRTLAAITYVASKNVPELTTYKLCKLLFLADKYHLVRYGRPITGDIYVAMEDGPVPSAVYDLLKFLLANRTPNARAAALIDHLQIDKKFRYPRIQAKKRFDADELSRSDITALDRAIKTYGGTGLLPAQGNHA